MVSIFYFFQFSNVLNIWYDIDRRSNKINILGTSEVISYSIKYCDVFDLIYSDIFVLKRKLKMNNRDKNITNKIFFSKVQQDIIKAKFF